MKMVTVVTQNNILSNLEAQRGHKYALLIGAGASHSSGIPTASEICNELTKLLYISSRGENANRLPYIDLEEAIIWRDQQEWYRSRGEENAYSILMRMYNQTEASRRKYLENLFEGKRPNNSLFHLAVAIKRGVFDIVLSTNFDRLIEDALRVVDAKLPVVVDHEARIETFRLTENRPKVIKLHGDFLYNPANLDSETDEILLNMREKLVKVLSEYGLIVVGYGGNDKSILNILETLANTPEGIPYGLYWLHRADDTLNPTILNLLDTCHNCFRCEIESADKFFQAVTAHLGLKDDVLSTRVDQSVPVKVEAASTASTAVHQPTGAFRLHDASPASFSVIELGLVKDFLSKLETARTTVTDADIIKFLTDEGLVIVDDGSSLKPSYSGLLLFGVNPRRFVPSAFVKCAFFKSSDEIVQEELHGTVPRIIESVLSFVGKYNEKTRDIRTIPVKDVFDFPPIAVREAVVNAVAHRDYSDFDRPVSVFIYSDRLEIMSPGGLIPTVSKDNLGKSSTNRGSRNITLHRVLNEMRYAEGLGTGIPRIIHQMKENGSPAPIFEVGDFSVTVKLPRREKTDVQKARLASTTDSSVLKTNMLKCTALPLSVAVADSDLSDYRELQQHTQPVGELASPYRGKIYFFGDETVIRNVIRPFTLGPVEHVVLDAITIARIRGPINDLFYQGVRKLLASKGLKILPRNEFFFPGKVPRTINMAGMPLEAVRRRGIYWLHEGLSVSLERSDNDYYLALLPRLFLTSDGQTIAPNEIAKGILTPLNSKRFNNIVRDSTETWRIFLGEGGEIVVPLGSDNSPISETSLVFGDYAIVDRGRAR